MKGRFTVIQLLAMSLVLVSFALIASSAHADDGQLLVGEVKLEAYPNVTLRFTANSATGLPVADLSEKQVRVFENGVDQGPSVVYALAQTATPLSIVLAMDTSGSMAGEPLAQAKQAAGTFVSEMRSRDRIALVSFNQQVALPVPFTSVTKSQDRSALLKSINNLAAKGDTKLYDAVYRAVSEVGSAAGNRAAVVLTDGEDTQSASSLDQAIDLAREKKVPVYVVALGQAVVEPVLQRLANETGGRYYYAPAPQDLSYAFKLLSQQLRNQYEMYYVSQSNAPVGTTIPVRLVLSPLGQPELVAEFTYVVPSFVERQKGEKYTFKEVDAKVGLFSDELIELLARIVGVLVFLGICLFVSGWLWRRERRRAEERLRNHVQALALPVHLTKETVIGRVAGPAALLFGRLGVRLLSAKEATRLRQNLVLAGRPFDWRVEHFMALKIVLAATAGILGFCALVRTDSLRAALVGFVGLALGYLLPQSWLGMRIKSRQNQILKALPDALDLLTISVEAGVGFDGAVLEVCQKWRNPLTEEFAIALQEIRIGRSRREALRDLAARTGVAEVTSFTSAVIQANELGTNIAHTLSAQAEQMRIRRRQRAEELAHQAAVKMLFPMVFLILPALFVVILGPAVPSLQFITTMGK